MFRMLFELYVATTIVSNIFITSILFAIICNEKKQGSVKENVVQNRSVVDACLNSLKLICPGFNLFIAFKLICISFDQTFDMKFYSALTEVGLYCENKINVLD